VIEGGVQIDLGRVALALALACRRGGGLGAGGPLGQTALDLGVRQARTWAWK
jgi:hypothetical protein